MKRLAIAVVVILVPVLAAVWVMAQLNAPYLGSDKPVYVEVPTGSSARAIAAQLRSAGVVRHEWTFRLLNYMRPSATLKAGEYEFARPASPREVIEKLRRGETFYIALTVPEGYNIFDIAEAAAAAGLASRDAMLAAERNTSLIVDLDPQAGSLEGYLFPDTYHFGRRTTPDRIVASMLARFRKVYGELERQHAPGRPTRETVTLASLVERETGIPGERPVVAGVYINRLTAGMPLQCDPTVIYAALLAGRYRGTIYQSDLQYDSPYNTYLRRGLPPGPIANPGRASLEAAMQPAATAYLYFVKGDNGGHRFARTLEEHSRNVTEYRQSQQGGAR